MTGNFQLADMLLEVFSPADKVLERMTEQEEKSRLTNISTQARENMPPAMQLEDEAPRHPNLPLKDSQTRAYLIINDPDSESGDEDYSSPSGEFLDLIAYGLVWDASRDYGTGLDAYDGYHDAKENRVHGGFVHPAVPGDEGGHESCHCEAGADG